MFEFSRALYRRIEPWLGGDPAGQEGALVLRSAEHAVRRIEDERHDAVLVARWLFREIRHLFPLHRQADVRRAVDELCAASATHARRCLDERLDVLGNPRRCPVLTRRGAPCRREPLANGHCPSHQHLLEDRVASFEAPVMVA